VYTLRSWASSICPNERSDKDEKQRLATRHDHTISTQQRVDQGFAEKHSVRHVQYSGSFLVTDVFKTDRIANLIAL
jgi:hypothetical protein